MLRGQMNPEEKYLKGIDLSILPPQAGEIIIAIGQYQNGEQITVKCPKCHKPLTFQNEGILGLFLANVDNVMTFAEAC